MNVVVAIPRKGCLRYLIMRRAQVLAGSEVGGIALTRLGTVCALFAYSIPLFRMPCENEFL